MLYEEGKKNSYVSWYAYILGIHEEDNLWDNKDYGLKLVSSQGFSRNRFECRGATGTADKNGELLLDAFVRLSDDYGDICVNQLLVAADQFSISYNTGGTELSSGELVCYSKYPGMRLEFESKRQHEGVDTFVIEWLDDPVFGNIIRLWEKYSDHTNIVTSLEGGRIIAVTTDKRTALEWRKKERDETEEMLEL